MDYGHQPKPWPEDLTKVEFEETKPALQSKTVLTSIAMGAFGVAASLGILPPKLNNPKTIGTVVTVGSFLVGLFRKKASKKI